MHMADALTAPAVATVMYVCSGTAAAYSVKKIRLENNSEKIPVMGVMGAFVFAAQMINFTIPGTGSSGHLCGGMLLSALLGPAAGFLTMIGILLIQCLLFADGGILALGCNIWNMAFYGCFLGSLVFWKPMMKNGFSKVKITLASVLGCIITLQLGAFSVTLETLISGITELPFATFISFMQPIHLAIGLVEGLITAAVLCFVHETRPNLLWCYNETEKESKLSFKALVGVLLIVSLVIGGGISLLASSYPDGLEWSIEKLTGSTELETGSKLIDGAAGIQEKTSLLADYTINGSEAPIGTTVSGIVGCLVVIVLCVAVCKLFKFFANTKLNKEEVNE